ncbi:serine hydrolase domain-containing protein [Robiginitalea sp. IMCC43444]|uniref:serine hydrolase domain-containing protein n=1 Tax=Robiginitalea sp. IMCC43444 TaxID=3459121 RepID=UPI0040436AFA
MKPTFFFLIISIGLSNIGWAQTSENQITTYLENVVNEYNIPSISAGILADGKIIWSGAAGFSNRELQVEASTETLYRIGSISKVLTAALVLKLVELDKLDLQDPIQKYLPDYPIDKKGQIKVFHLLSHTSGIDHYKGKETRSFMHYDNLRDASRLFETRKLKFEPGTKYRYTSYGYTLLGAVIEAATGKSYAVNLKELILEKAGMYNTHVEDHNRIKLNQAKLYKKKENEIISDVDNDLSNIYPAGGLVSTATDLLLFFEAWRNGELISFENVQKMVDAIEFNGQILDENAGLGWNIWKHNKHGWVCHRIGGQSGTSALLISYREKNVTVALLSNQAVLDPIWEIANTLIGFGLDRKE